MAIFKSIATFLIASALIFMVTYWAAGRAKPELDATARQTLLDKQLAHHFIELGQGVVHYRLEGPEHGPLIVLIHGFAMPSFDGYFAPLTRAGYRVLSYDLYGRGFSDRPDGPYDAAFFDRQLVDLLDSLGVTSPVHLAGYSLGGSIATIFAARHPDRVRSLLLMAPAGLGTHFPQQNSILTKPLIGDWLVRLFGQRIFHENAALAAQTAPNPARFMAEFDRQMDYAGYGEAMLSTMRHFPLDGSEWAFAAAGRHPRPVLLLWGSEDTVIPYAYAARIKALMPNMQLRSFPGMNHDIFYAEPAAISMALIEFLHSPSLDNPPDNRHMEEAKEAAGMDRPR